MYCYNETCAVLKYKGFKYVLSMSIVNPIDPVFFHSLPSGAKMSSDLTVDALVDSLASSEFELTPQVHSLFARLTTTYGVLHHKQTTQTEKNR